MFARLANAATFFFGAPEVTTTVVNAANSSLTTFAFNGVRANESKTIRRTGLAIRHFPFAILFLAVKPGSSARIVFTPTNIASAPKRKFMANARDCSPVIHLDSPEAVAILPSSVIAALTVMNGVR